jgi:hypothetical protein
MSALRPTLRHVRHGGGLPSPDTFDALYLIRDAVERRGALIHGKLRDDGGVCAVGAFFADNDHLALPTTICDQVAAYNDSMPDATAQQRRDRVLAWLNARLDYLRIGIPHRAQRTIPLPVKHEARSAGNEIAMRGAQRR